MEKTREQALQAVEVVAVRYQELKSQAEQIFKTLKSLDGERKPLVQQHGDYLAAGQASEARNLLDAIGANRRLYDEQSLVMQDIHRRTDECLSGIKKIHNELAGRYSSTDNEIDRLYCELGNVTVGIEQLGYFQKYISSMQEASKQGN